MDDSRSPPAAPDRKGVASVRSVPGHRRGQRAVARAAALVALSGIGFNLGAESLPGLALAQGAGGAAVGTASPAQIDIRVGRNPDATRVEIYGTVGARASVRRDGAQLIVRLPAAERPDLGSLRTNLPPGIKSVDLKGDNRANELIFTLQDKVDARFGRADGAVYLQIASPGAAPSPLNSLLPQTQSGASASASSSASSLTIALDVVPVSISTAGGGNELDFAFPGPVGSAVFQRGEFVWLLFDREVSLNLPGDLKSHGLIDASDLVHHDGFTALRLHAPAAGSLSVISDGPTWRVRIGGTPLVDPKASQVGIIRDDSTGVPQINANLPGASRVAWIRDPSVGDRIAVIPARGPVKALGKTRQTLQMTLDTTAHGLVLERLAPDVKLTIDGDLVEISRPGGLILSSAMAGGEPARVDYAPGPYPSVMDMSKWGRVSGGDFLPTYNQLQLEAAAEAEQGPDGPIKARLTLARFLVGHELNYEAQGVMDLLIRKSPRAGSDPYVRGLRLMAKILSRRFKSAQVDLDSPALAADPAANLWRGYVAVQDGRFADARKAFAQGAVALDSLPPVWRVRLASANANAALETGDMGAARQLMRYVVAIDVPPLERLESLLVAGHILEMSGDKMQALGVYGEISKASLGRIATPAMMHAARLKLELGKANSQQTVAALNGLRFRWRGDNTELDIISTMGDILLKSGRYRDALDILRSGGQKFFNRPQAAALNTRLNEAFRALFLNGMADGLQPIEALGLFYDFQSLTPPGADGDLIVRKLVRRLVDVDLLDKAASLLQYQVDNRLEGVSKADVAADLSAIYLMNREPEKALQSLWKTRTTLLPKPLLAERRVLEARALNELGQSDQALEALGMDDSRDGLGLKAEIMWKQKNWAQSAQAFERALGDRWKQAGNLSLEEEGRLIRAGVAFSLAADGAGLERLSQHYGKFIAAAQSPDALRVALAGLDSGPISGKEFALAAAQADAFTGWVAGMKKKLRDEINAAAATRKTA